MKEADGPIDVRRFVSGAFGVTLLGVGFWIAIWVVGVVRQALYSPEELRLLDLVLQGGSQAVAFSFGEDDGQLSGQASRLFVLAILFIALISTLGGIVSGLLSGGVKLFRDAMWGPPVRTGDRHEDD